MFYLLKTIDVSFADEGDSLTIAIGTGRTTNTMHIVFSIVGHIIV